MQGWIETLESKGLFVFFRFTDYGREGEAF